MVLDNDETVDTNNKYSTVKVYSAKKGQLNFVEEWDSSSFGTTGDVYPINDLEVKDSSVVVTLGNYGIGYGQLNKKGQLTKTRNIHLSAVPDVKTIFLSTSFFKQVEIL